MFRGSFDEVSASIEAEGAQREHDPSNGQKVTQVLAELQIAVKLLLIDFMVMVGWPGAVYRDLDHPHRGSAQPAQHKAEHSGIAYVDVTLIRAQIPNGLKPPHYVIPAADRHPDKCETSEDSSAVVPRQLFERRGIFAG